MAKILIADDDLYIRELYEEILKDAGYEVDISVDGQECLDKLSTTNYELVLLDIMMPKKDGLAVLNDLKNLPAEKKRGKIVVLTNLAHDPVLKDALANGAAGYLIKADMTPDVLLEKIKSYLNG